METALQQLNADRNKMSKEIGAKRYRGEASVELEDRVRQIGDQISALTQKSVPAKSSREIASANSEFAAQRGADWKGCERQSVVRSWGENRNLTGKFWITLRWERSCSCSIWNAQRN